LVKRIGLDGTANRKALRELVDRKTKGLATTPRAIAEPPKVINLMEPLKAAEEDRLRPAST
jgi:non-homologous end joining protein Ku